VCTVTEEMADAAMWWHFFARMDARPEGGAARR
jgi:hypothetical protein